MCERPEWSTVIAAVLAEHGELESEDVEAAGRLVDDPSIFVGSLDAPTVSGLAAVLAARRKRLARRSP